MIITIDTAKDSHQDIKKLIKFLEHHVGDSTIYNNIENNDIPSPSSGMFDMFGDNSLNSSENILSNADSLLGEDDDLQEEEEPEERINILPY